jgi:hypothetical protein
MATMTAQVDREAAPRHLDRSAPLLADAIEAKLGPRDDRDGSPPLAAERLGRAPHRDREGVQGGRRAALLTARPAAPPHQPLAPARRAVGAHRRDGRGQTDLATTANTYTRVLVDETEVDYEQLLAAV